MYAFVAGHLISEHVDKIVCVSPFVDRSLFDSYAPTRLSAIYARWLLGQSLLSFNSTLPMRLLFPDTDDIESFADIMFLDQKNFLSSAFGYANELKMIENATQLIDAAKSIESEFHVVVGERDGSSLELAKQICDGSKCKLHSFDAGRYPWKHANEIIDLLV
jgi:hypothetical protein